MVWIPVVWIRKLTCPLNINGWNRCISYGNSAFLGDMLFFRGVITSWIKPLPLQKSDLPHLPVSEPHLPPKHRRQVTRQEGKVWVKFTMKPWSFRKKKNSGLYCNFWGTDIFWYYGSSLVRWDFFMMLLWDWNIYHIFTYIWFEFMLNVRIGNHSITLGHMGFMDCW